MRDGRVIVADTHYHRMVLFTQQGELLGTFGQEGTGPGDLFYPVDVTQDDAGNLYISEYGKNDRIQKFTADGKYIAEVGGPGEEPGKFQRPSGLTWHAGKIYIADAVNNRVQIFNDDLTFVDVLGGVESPVSFGFPYDVFVGPDERLYIAEYKTSRVTCASLDGGLIGRFGGPGTSDNQFRTPWGISVDAAGRVLVADTGNRRIVELHL
jgi:DNA-binding beta-propeller fold protein YncE